MIRKLNGIFTLLVFSVLVFGLGNPLPVHAAKAKRKGIVCVSGEGSLIVRLAKKCRSTESQIDVAALQEIAPSNVGEQGPKGEPGIDGNDGSPGVDGVSGYEFVENQLTVELVAGQNQTVNVFCPAGKVMLGGGCSTSSLAVVNIQNSMKLASADTFRYTCSFNNVSSIQIQATMSASAACADALN